MPTVVQVQGHGYTAESAGLKYWVQLLFQLYASECTPSVDRA